MDSQLKFVLLFVIQAAVTRRRVPDCMSGVRSVYPGMSMNRY